MSRLVANTRNGEQLAGRLKVAGYKDGIGTYKVFIDTIVYLPNEIIIILLFINFLHVILFSNNSFRRNALHSLSINYLYHLLLQGTVSSL